MLAFWSRAASDSAQTQRPRSMSQGWSTSAGHWVDSSQASEPHRSEHQATVDACNADRARVGLLTHTRGDDDGQRTQMDIRQESPRVVGSLPCWVRVAVVCGP
uniref:Uncharacterized protein n=1 Tax=uncultured marine virus TaxID=186617 RepID=A0A0F7L8G4_9VIRU|nr:hypothetical protein [uncultured marine virus]